VLSYVALAFTISWGGVLLAVGSGGFPGTVEQFEARLVHAVLAMLAGPSVAGLVAVAMADGRAGLHDLLILGAVLRLMVAALTSS
jgi:hypothetical protein